MRQHLAGHKALRQRWRDDSGAGPVDLAIVTLPLLVMVFVTIAIGLLFYANLVALAAAQQGAATARAYQAPADAGVAHAADFVDRAVGDSFGSPQVAISGDANSVEVTVQLYPMRMVPLLPDSWFSISQTVSGPRERVTAPGAP